VELSSILSVAVTTTCLFVVAVAMMLWHVRAWRAHQQQELDAEEADYRRRQFRRRMQTSAMLAILAVAILVGYIVTMWLRSPTFTLVFWIMIVLALFWTSLLAIVDMWATKHHFRRMRDHCLIEQAKLRAELNRMQAFRGNGKGKNVTGTPQNKLPGDQMN
jgi:hypothetical protein